MVLVRRPKTADAAVARLVRGARAMLAWSQTELAERSGVAARTLANIETGRRVPRDGTVERLAVAFAQAGIEMFESPDGFGLLLKISKDDGQVA
ncbi:helix-turn-helix transcriptional regulator [Methylobacterium sp. C25]|uniref:helix-turn-helix domain-containing protein n=1 Tax=Methylobacterium sp. C25 TaxID=2721622 RepID=UPI001F464EA8|nr:helix-turn-helix transcriptional regulator [Methylobacterium sp. C25]MCE4225013.1 helix-turn-helix transcriptional regulator [Methylobacterium sp. C25]